jgi:hypothetical protein
MSRSAIRQDLATICGDYVVAKVAWAAKTFGDSRQKLGDEVYLKVFKMSRFLH